MYTLDAWDANSCNVITTIDVGLAPVPSVALGPDTTICYFDSIVIGTAAPGDTYLWSTTATTPTIAVYGSAGPATYYVTVTNGAGCSSSDTIQIAVNPCEGAVNNVVQGSGLSVYPNPAADRLYISDMANHGLQHISICNAYGAKVYEELLDMHSTADEIDVAHFAPGIYAVQVMSNDAVLTEKLVITR